MNPSSQAPLAERKPKDLSLFGVERNDPYYWLNQREDKEVLDYLHRENSYLETVMKPYESLQSKLYDEMIARLKPDDSNLPYKRGDYFYYSRYVPQKEYPLYCRRKHNLEAPEEIMLDGNAMAKGEDYFNIGSYSVSPDQNLLAYTVDTTGRRIYSIRFKDLRTGKTLPDVIEHVDSSLAWAADNRTLFYVHTDPETLRSFQVYRHQLGQVQKEDVLVFEEMDDTYYLYVFPTHSQDYIVLQSSSTLSAECRVLSSNDPQAKPVVISPREQDHRYTMDHHGDDFLIISNKNAVNFQVFTADTDNFHQDAWKTCIAHREAVLVEDVHQFKNYVVTLEREKGQHRICVMPRDGSPPHAIEFDQPVYSLELGRNYQFDTEWLRFNFESLATPFSTFDYHMGERTRKLMKQKEVLGSFDPDAYTTQRLEVPARDGAMIPMSLVFRKDLPKDKPNPLVLYGYGAYGHTIDPYFKSARLSLLDRGFVFAIAHIRGGSALGRQWYEAGKMLNKKNTFNDFLDCADFLVKEKRTSPECLFALGGSAGGMLMGVVANQRPELFKGVIANVPFVDCVTTMLDTSIPLTTGEFDEWGNPAQEPYFHYILDYSPYDNVKAQDYPHLLVITGLHDSQVQYWEPAKWVAKLRHQKTDDHWLLLHTQMEAGHGGASGRFRRYEEEALQYAFLLALAGLAEKG